MDPSVLLKMLADVSLWLAIAGTLFPQTAASVSTPIVFAVLSLSGALGSLPGEKRAKLRFLALIPLSCAAFFITGLESALVYAPPALYIAATVILRRYSYDREEFASFFKKVVICLAVWILLALLFGGKERVEGAAVIFAVFFAVCGVTLMRILRHEESVRREPRFILLCMCAPAAVIIAAALLSLPGVTSAIGAALKFFYDNVVSPLLMLLAYVMVGVVYVVGAVIGEIKPADATENQLELGEVGLGDEMMDYLRSGEQSENAGRVFIALAFIAFFVIAFIVFRRMLGRRKTSDPVRSAAEIRSGTAPYDNARPLSSVLRAGTPAGLVRGYYARFLRRAEAAGVEIPIFYTSEMIAGASRAFFPEETLNAFREIYVRARYGGVVTREDAKLAKAYLEKLRYRPGADK